MTPSVAIIKGHVARQCGVTVKELEGKRRCRSIARPRQIAMYLASTMTPHSLPAIGRLFGGRDHSTASHAVHQVEYLIENDREFATLVARIKATMPVDLGNGPVAVAETLEETERLAREAAVRRAKTEPGFTVSGHPETVRRTLLDLYGEVPASDGRTGDGGRTELLIAESGTWSLLELTGDGARARIAGSGFDWSADTAADPAPQPPSGPRPCLKCGQPFAAAGPLNRICKPCTQTQDRVCAPFAESVSN